MIENSAKLRVLFVDDEAEILNGLRLTLRKERKRFDMLFAEGGAEALETLENHPIDVVCTDLQMPDLDGSQLLARLVEHYPSVGRVVLSGHANDDVAIRAMSLAHRFLVKPTDRDSIVAALADVHATLGSIERPDLREVAGGAAFLPADPGLYAALSRRVLNETGDIDEVANILLQDPAMAAKALQYANSSYISTQPKITCVTQAARTLGFSTLQAMVPYLGPTTESTQAPSQDSAAISAIRLESLLTGQVAEHIARDQDLNTELASTAGLLSGIGMLLLESRAPDLANRARLRALTEDLPIHAIQQLEFGVDHTELATGLLGSWGLPQPILDLIRDLHRPSDTESDHFDLNGTLHIAYYLAHQSLNQLAEGQTRSPQHLDLGFVHTMKISAELRDWNDFARHLAEQMLNESDYKAA